MGKYARGFYYAALPISAPVTDEAIDRLVSWRLTTNDAAPRDLFDPDALKPCPSRLREFVGRN